MLFPIPGYRSKSPVKMFLASLVYGIIIIFLVIAYIDPQANTQATAKELESVKITTEIQNMINENGKQKVTVHAQNNGDKIFDGSISVMSISKTGKVVDSDVMLVEKLAPGKSTYAITWLENPSIVEHKIKGEFAK